MPTARDPAQGSAGEPARGALECDHYNPERDVFWGDLHVHTGLSGDAYSSDVRLLPEDAYRFATGEPVKIPPLGANGRGTQEVRLARPLDFIAVTDHAETYGISELCANRENAAYESQGCQYYRRLPATPALKADPDLPSRLEIEQMVCGQDFSKCRAAAATPWQESRAAAARWNEDSGACRFTSFVAYEWSGARGGPLLHRNVIFRNQTTPGPVSSRWAPRPWDLFDRLERECLQAGNGCDVLAIPHNSNTSQGAMFERDYPSADTRSAEADLARRRARLEPVIEIMQHKGDSECRSGLSKVLGDPDELCDFEKLFPAELPECGPDRPIIDYDVTCTDVGGFGRYGLAIGLAEKDRLGENPFQFGFIAATDTHNATGGQVDEAAWKGHVGIRDNTPASRMSIGHRGAKNALNNPGGLAGVWAEQNTRDALFEAIRRRETFGTSGPRISVRFFGGFDLEEGLCSDSRRVAKSYASGVAMGGVLSTSGEEREAPRFLVEALADPGTAAFPGGLLQRAQIVKVWNDAEGRIHQRIFEVAGDAKNGASVDPTTCERSGPGLTEICTVFEDPEFDPATPAVYYARIVENPSCRWQTRDCLGLAPGDRPESCEDAELPRVVQERAWSSPIWYETNDGLRG